MQKTNSVQLDYVAVETHISSTHLGLGKSVEGSEERIGDLKVSHERPQTLASKLQQAEKMDEGGAHSGGGGDRCAGDQALHGRVRRICTGIH